VWRGSGRRNDEEPQTREECCCFLQQWRSVDVQKLCFHLFFRVSSHCLSSGPLTCYIKWKWCVCPEKEKVKKQNVLGRCAETQEDKREILKIQRGLILEAVNDSNGGSNSQKWINRQLYLFSCLAFDGRRMVGQYQVFFFLKGRTGEDGVRWKIHFSEIILFIITDNVLLYVIKPCIHVLSMYLWMFFVNITLMVQPAK